MFRAFLHYTGKELKNMSIDEYIDNSLILTEVLKLIHAPYLDHNN